MDQTEDWEPDACSQHEATEPGDAGAADPALLQEQYSQEQYSLEQYDQAVQEAAEEEDVEEGEAAGQQQQPANGYGKRGMVSLLQLDDPTDGPGSNSWPLSTPTSLLMPRSSVAQAMQLDGKSIKLGQRLGSGSFATVYAATMAGSKRKWVVKRLDRMGRHQLSQVMNELEVMAAAGRHPNLVAFRGWYVDGQGVICLVLGCCEGGTLASMLKSHTVGAAEGTFPEAMVMCWGVQLLLALHHLHGRSIMHRDIKPENVLLSANKRVALLADLGVAKQLEPDGVGLALTCLGTPHYMSPEVISARPYTSASDIWAMGCVLYEAAARAPAFAAKGLPQLALKILRNGYAPLPSTFSRPFQQLVGMMLRVDPETRPSTRDLLATSIVRKHLQQLLGMAKVPRAPAGPSTAAAARRSSAGSDEWLPPPTPSTPGPAAAAGPLGIQFNSSGAGSVSGGAAGAGAGGSSAAAALLNSSSGSGSAGPGSLAGTPPASRLGSIVSAARVSVDLGGVTAAIKKMAKTTNSTGSTTMKRARLNSSSTAERPEGTQRVASGSAAAASLKRPGGSATAAGAAGGVSGPAAAGAGATSKRGLPSALVVGGGAGSAAAAGSPGMDGALPSPVVTARKKVVKRWEASASWEQQQRKAAELRRAATLMEQRLAREQAHQWRKGQDPAAAARAAQLAQQVAELQAAREELQAQQAAAEKEAWAAALRQQYGEDGYGEDSSQQVEGGASSRAGDGDSWGPAAPEVAPRAPGAVWDQIDLSASLQQRQEELQALLDQLKQDEAAQGKAWGKPKASSAPAWPAPAWPVAGGAAGDTAGDADATGGCRYSGEGSGEGRVDDAGGSEEEAGSGAGSDAAVEDLEEVQAAGSDVDVAGSGGEGLDEDEAADGFTEQTEQQLPRGQQEVGGQQPPWYQQQEEGQEEDEEGQQQDSSTVDADAPADRAAVTARAPAGAVGMLPAPAGAGASSAPAAGGPQLRQRPHTANAAVSAARAAGSSSSFAATSGLRASWAVSSSTTNSNSSTMDFNRSMPGGGQRSSSSSSSSSRSPHRTAPLRQQWEAVVASLADEDWQALAAQLPARSALGVPERNQKHLQQGAGGAEAAAEGGSMAVADGGLVGGEGVDHVGAHYESGGEEEEQLQEEEQEEEEEEDDDDEQENAEEEEQEQEEDEQEEEEEQEEGAEEDGQEEEEEQEEDEQEDAQCQVGPQQAAVGQREDPAASASQMPPPPAAAAVQSPPPLSTPPPSSPPAPATSRAAVAEPAAVANQECGSWTTDEEGLADDGQEVQAGSASLSASPSAAAPRSVQGPAPSQLEKVQEDQQQLAASGAAEEAEEVPEEEEDAQQQEQQLEAALAADDSAAARRVLEAVYRRSVSASRPGWSGLAAGSRSVRNPLHQQLAQQMQQQKQRYGAGPGAAGRRQLEVVDAVQLAVGAAAGGRATADEGSRYGSSSSSLQGRSMSGSSCSRKPGAGVASPAPARSGSAALEEVGPASPSPRRLPPLLQQGAATTTTMSSTVAAPQGGSSGSSRPGELQLAAGSPRVMASSAPLTPSSRAGALLGSTGVVKAGFKFERSPATAGAATDSSLKSLAALAAQKGGGPASPDLAVSGRAGGSPRP